MPKKNSSWGTNTKAVESKERKNEKKRGDQETKQKAVDDASWKDENKLDQKKKDRKEKDQQKKLEVLSRKQESKKLLDEEEKAMAVPSMSASSSTSGKGKKVTLSEIEKVKEMERKKQERLHELKKKEKSNITEVPSEMECDNPNREMAELLASENVVEARSVEDAVAVLNINAGDVVEDQHPEKRMKAAYNEFEEIRLPILKKENPSLRHTQLKKMLWKEWQKSPDNPMNI